MNKAILAATSAVVGATAISGSAASQTRSDTWYSRLRKPSYVPPSGVFPVAWTTLYGDIAVTSAAGVDRLQQRGETAKLRGLVAALALNLVLNGGWSWLFFRCRRLGLAAVGAAALTASSADLTRRVGQAEPRAGVALLAYPLWCAFATVMSADIWRRNRDQTAST